LNKFGQRILNIQKYLTNTDPCWINGLVETAIKGIWGKGSWFEIYVGDMGKGMCKSRVLMSLRKKYPNF